MNSLPGLKLCLPGAPRIELDGAPVQVDRRKAVALLAYLALTGQSHSRETLAALFWPEYEPGRAYAYLRRALWALNQALGEGWLLADRETVGLNRDAASSTGTGRTLWLDVDRFRQLLAACQAHGHAETEVCAACLPPLTQAAELYQGDFLAGFTLRDSPQFDEWQFFQAESLRQELVGALERLARYHGAQGAFEPAIAYARRWLALDPLHEPAHRHLMELYARAGQRPAALRQYQEYVRVLREELDAPPEEETTTLYERIRAKELDKADERMSEDASPSVPIVPRHNLPPQPTHFIGREPELAEIARLLENPDCRLLTLVGPGGVGKTRLALEAATGLAHAPISPFPHGVYFAPLAALSSGEFLVPAIADALAFSFYSQAAPRQQLLSYLQGKQMFLILDSFEHLMQEASLVTEILQNAPQVQVLATSRERLNLQGEWVLEIQGMRFPAGARDKAFEAYSAVALFLQHARAAQVGFTPLEQDEEHIVRICRLVEGMPLGIELAAAWVKMLSCEEIAQEIERSLDFLSTSMRDAPARHQSLRAVFEHPWRLLAETEKAALKKLSVFRGGFTRQAAGQVASASLPLLTALVDKSLLRRTSPGRYEMLEVLRQHAEEKLAPQEKKEVQDRHCDYYAAFLQGQEKDLKGARQRAALEEINREIENVRASWHWATARGKVEQIKHSLASLHIFYEMRSWLLEGESAFGKAVAALGGPDSALADLEEETGPVLGVAMTAQAWFSLRVGPVEPARELVQKGFAILRQLGLQGKMAFYVPFFGPSSPKECAEWEQLVQKNMALWKERGDWWSIAYALHVLGRATEDQFRPGGYQEARRLYEESLAISKEVGDSLQIVVVLSALGFLTQIPGELEASRQYYQEGVAISRKMNYQYGVSLYLDYLGYVARMLEEYAEAEQCHRESLAIAKEIGDLLGVAGSLDNLGLVAHDLGDYAEAERLFREGLAIRQKVGDSAVVVTSLDHLGNVALARAEYSRAGQLFKESLDLYRKSVWQMCMASPLNSLGNVHNALGEYQAAKACFQEALSTAMQAQMPYLLLDGLVGTAALLAREGKTERALELAALARRHPASTRQTRDRAGQLLSELASRLPPQAVTAAQERGQRRELEKVVEEVLAKDIFQETLE
jgi:predicted ATPase/DNA-binding SARP family transcriptional activator